MSNFGVKRAKHCAWPQPTLPAGEAVVIVGASKPAPHPPPRRSHGDRRGPNTMAAPNQPNQPNYRH
jgi:hypothetical protein